ncbi:MAG: TldD/PmbA family protein [Crenarchaeota archaeon]|nr:TldD/PmbA family protein [Thermoproteota archaeon]
MIDDIVDLAYRVMKILRDRGIEGDVYCEYSREITAECREGRFQTASVTEEKGLGLRVIVDNRVGFVYTSKIDASPIDLVDRACKIARICSRVDKWRGLPRPGKFPHVPDIYSPELENTTIENVLENVNKFLKEYEKDRQVFSFWVAEIGVSVSKIFLINSEGVEASYNETTSISLVEVNARKETYVTPGVYEAEYSKKNLVDLVEVYEKAKEKARSLLDPVKLDEKNIAVVVTTKALAELLSNTIKPMLTASSFALKMSPFIGKIGQELFSRELTLIDDATVPGGLSSAPFDDEGVPTRRNILIENGILRGVISNIYWGSMIDIDSTGNGFRGDYSTTPGIYYTNVEILPGSLKMEELYNSEEPILLVDYVQGAHTSNPVSGEFSVAAPCSWIVKKGEKKAVKGIMMSGKMYDILREARFTKERETLLTFTLPYMYVPRGLISIVT